MAKSIIGSALGLIEAFGPMLVPGVNAAAIAAGVRAVDELVDAVKESKSATVADVQKAEETRLQFEQAVNDHATRTANSLAD